MKWNLIVFSLCIFQVMLHFKDKCWEGAESVDMTISGERFGKLVVIGQSSEIKYGCHTVLCRCDCGETISVPPFKLWSGQYKSCGCGRGKRIDPSEMIGKKFGDLTVLEQTEHLIRGTRTYLCRCDCGNLTHVLPSNLRSGNTKSCGCKKTRDISGKRFGSLIAIEPTGEVHPTNKTRLWRCICDCGNETIADYKHLKEGERVSCGCAKGGVKPLDITGRRFGRLTAIRRLDIKNTTSYKWLCQCDCGKTTQVSIANLTSGGTKSCGCLRSGPRSAKKNGLQKSLQFAK